jgi:hypothetical protein
MLVLTHPTPTKILKRLLVEPGLWVESLRLVYPCTPVGEYAPLDESHRQTLPVLNMVRDGVAFAVMAKPVITQGKAIPCAVATSAGCDSMPCSRIVEKKRDILKMVISVSTGMH